MQNLVLYDGECGLCDRTVQFILRHDRRGRFVFATLQGERGSAIAREHGIDPAVLSTFVLVLGFAPPTPSLTVLVRGKSALRVLWELGFPWSLIGWLWGLPAWLVDPGYALIARNRYRIFGRLETCRMPTPSEKARFLD